jgi:hypothetical protein
MTQFYDEIEAYLKTRKDGATLKQIMESVNAPCLDALKALDEMYVLGKIRVGVETEPEYKMLVKKYYWVAQ